MWILLLRCAAEYWRTTIEGSRRRFLDFSQDPNGPPVGARVAPGAASHTQTNKITKPQP